MTVIEALKKIEALCNAPHWEPKRRWEIEQIARATRMDLENILESAPKAMVNATLCPICGEVQYMTPSGITCPNGHGGVDEGDELYKETGGRAGRLR